MSLNNFLNGERLLNNPLNGLFDGFMGFAGLRKTLSIMANTKESCSEVRSVISLINDITFLVKSLFSLNSLSLFTSFFSLTTSFTPFFTFYLYSARFGKSLDFSLNLLDFALFTAHFFTPDLPYVRK